MRSGAAGNLASGLRSGMGGNAGFGTEAGMGGEASLRDSKSDERRLPAREGGFSAHPFDVIPLPHEVEWGV